MKRLFENNHDFGDIIGETVTVFTQSGGESGQGFTGVLIAANSCFIRLVTGFGSAPDSAFNRRGGCCCGGGGNGGSRFGSVTDIPVDKIVAFVHNAV